MKTAIVDRNIRARALRVAALAAAAGFAISVAPMLAPTLAHGQVAVPNVQSGGVAITGEDFAGVRYTQGSIGGNIAFKARRAFVWDSGEVKRIQLHDDVVVTLGEYSFIAKQAGVWMQRVSAQGAQPEVYQVFVAFDQVGNPGDAVGFGVSADRLPVRAVIELRESLSLNADLVINQAPDGPGRKGSERELAFAVASREMMASSLRKMLGIEPLVAAVAPAPFVRRMMIDPATLPPETAVATAPAGSGLKPPPAAATKSTTQASRTTPPSGASTTSPSTPPTTSTTRSTTTSTPRPSTTGAVASTPSTSSPSPADSGIATTTTGNQGTPTGAAAGTGAAVPAGTVVAGTQPPTAAAPITPTPSPTPSPTQAPAGASSSVTGGAGPAQTLAATAPLAPIFAREGIILVSGKDITMVSGTEENAVIVAGGVVMQYTDRQTGRTLQMTAQRAAIFTDPGSLADTAQFKVEQVRGIFLEGEVTATDGKYTLRGPQIYYDIRANKAVMLDAVFWTYDERRQLPLYMRASSIRQTATDQFEANKAVFTNTAFFDPELSLGASNITIKRQTVAVPQTEIDRVAGAKPAETMTTFVTADNVVLKAGPVPIFYWPSYSGDAQIMPIKDLRVENRNGSGLAFKVGLNAYALLGMKTPSDTRIDLLTDIYTERGIGLGTRMSWDKLDSKGSLFAYMLPNDNGTDVLKPGTEKEQDGAFRGLIVGDQRWRIDDKWTLFAEGSYISDETLIDALYEEVGEARREFTNRLRADRIEENTQLSLEAKGTFNDFLANEWLLQSQGYSVNKTPEGMYVRQADDLLSGSNPGLLTYWSEYRAGVLSMSFDEIKPEDRGFNTPYLSQRAFGLNQGQSYADSLSSQGYIDDSIFRADTRQEISAQFKARDITIQPFVTGRATAYDNKFSQFSPDEDDQARLHGSVGVRASTTFQRVYDGVDSRLFDIHRLRHIIEPSISAWYAGTTIESQDLPIYDDSVESLANRGIVRFGATQIFQTQRGGPGQWHNVDLLTITTDFVISDSSSDAKTPIGRFFDYRPEYANPGNYFVGDLVYRLTDATAITGSTVYDFDRNQQAMSSTGVNVRHSQAFSTFGDLRYINDLDSTYVNVGATYEFTSKYSATASAAYDVDIGGFQSSDFEIRRNFSSMLFGIGIGYNDITGQTSLGFVFKPYGASGEARLDGTGRASRDFGS